jgi:hypothetical protein
MAPTRRVIKNKRPREVTFGHRRTRTPPTGLSGGRLSQPLHSRLLRRRRLCNEGSRLHLCGRRGSRLFLHSQRLHGVLAQPVIQHQNCLLVHGGGGRHQGERAGTCEAAAMQGCCLVWQAAAARRPNRARLKGSSAGGKDNGWRSTSGGTLRLDKAAAGLRGACVTLFPGFAFAPRNPRSKGAASGKCMRGCWLRPAAAHLSAFVQGQQKVAAGLPRHRCTALVGQDVLVLQGLAAAEGNGWVVGGLGGGGDGGMPGSRVRR